MGGGEESCDGQPEEAGTRCKEGDAGWMWGVGGAPRLRFPVHAWSSLCSTVSHWCPWRHSAWSSWSPGSTVSAVTVPSAPAGVGWGGGAGGAGAARGARWPGDRDSPPRSSPVPPACSLASRSRPSPSSSGTARCCYCPLASHWPTHRISRPAHPRRGPSLGPPLPWTPTRSPRCCATPR